MSNVNKTYEEMAREEDEKVAQGREAEGYVRVAARVASDLGHVMMLRFSQEEIAVIRKKAKAKGIGVAEYVREAALGTTRRSK